jgi:hypothetical protein
MTNHRWFVRFALPALASLLAGCGDDPVPDHPTWANDVLPILRGNCFNCHGATARKTARTMRWDVCDLTAFSDVGPFQTDPIHADPTDPEVEFMGARLRMPPTFSTYLQPHPPNQPLMPPLPAAPLSDRQRAIVAAWNKDPVCGKRTGNHAPTATWLGSDRQHIAIADRDDDQVLGTMVCGTSETVVGQAGILELPAGARPPCSLRLSDGQDAVKVDLRP